jgi:hypothetical protein
MSLRTALMGTLALLVAFGGAYAFGSTSGDRAVAHGTPATVITVSRDLAPLPSLTPRGALPELAKRPARPHRPKRRTRVTPPATPEQPAPPAARSTLPRAPAPQRQPRAPRPDRSYDEPDYEPPAPRATPVPTPVPPREPDPVEEVPEDGTPE